MSDQSDAAREFQREAEAGQHGMAREILDFLVQNKKWWLAPIMLILLLFSVFVILAGTGVAPFIYTLF